MRILFLESHPMWTLGLPNGFRDLGFHVKISGPLTDRNICFKIKEFQPDLIFTIGWTPDNETAEKQILIGNSVKMSGVPHVYWATEDPGYTAIFTLPLIMRVKPDFVFTICPSKVEYYESLGISAAHLDFGFHSSIHCPTARYEQYQGTIALVANGYPKLYEKNPDLFRFTSLHTLIDPLQENNFRVEFYGRYWDSMRSIFKFDIPSNCVHGYLPYTEVNKVYSSVDIIIGLQNIPNQLTQRTYEVLGSGGFLLTSDTPAVRNLFKPGQDLVVSATKSDTLQIVRYYLKNPDERRKVCQQGRLAVSKHSYRHRAEYILDILHKRNIL
jgi:spore maturation protein CgeB